MMENDYFASVSPGPRGGFLVVHKVLREDEDALYPALRIREELQIDYWVRLEEDPDDPSSQLPYLPNLMRVAARAYVPTQNATGEKLQLHIADMGYLVKEYWDWLIKLDPVYSPTKITPEEDPNASEG